MLFADLKGSMELLADRDPEEARKILDPVLERMMEAVHRYEGTVNQVMGDGIMALFGAPLAHEDHAVRACYAALRMQESVKQYAEEVHRTAGVPLHIRVGVNSGEVVVRSIGSDLHMDYTAVGQTTHLAALEQMAMPGSILIAPETLNLAEGFVVVKSLGKRPVKGLEARTEVFEVVGVGSVRSRLQPLKRLLVERTEGNPFFLEESVRTLVETKVLAGERAAYHLAKAAWNFGSWFPPIASALGTAYALDGRVTEALPHLEQAVTQADSMTLMGRQCLRLAALSEAYLAVGRQSEALDRAERALGLSRRYKERGSEAWTLRLLGEVIATADTPDFEHAADYYRRARARAIDLGMRPLIAHCHLGLGRLDRRTGKREQAQGHLATATTMYRAMGMDFWLEMAEAEMRELAR
ncbi:MAG TPA: adenylate/guanylate cyclase domain-containing protein [Methylomirabilota bacterium]|nr:adenylate/guanylate cyclase domain-containing protein [Methylomirabilota bacterium]